MLRLLSLGAGVQSSTLALMAARGEVAPFDAAVFADTGGEPRAVYEWLAWLEREIASCPRPFAVHRVARGDLWRAATTVRRSKKSGNLYIQTAIPVFTLDGLRRGKGLRHCTRDYKIAPITKKVRALLGLRQVRAGSGVLATMAIGISTDEVDRMKPNPNPWIRNVFPLIDADMSRDGCLEWMLWNGYPRPPRSACTFCPFRSDESWRALAPDEFRDAAKKERQLQRAYAKTGQLTATPYLHSARVPLSQVVLAAAAPELDKFRNECEGMCGV